MFVSETARVEDRMYVCSLHVNQYGPKIPYNIYILLCDESKTTTDRLSDKKKTIKPKIKENIRPLLSSRPEISIVKIKTVRPNISIDHYVGDIEKTLITFALEGLFYVRSHDFALKPYNFCSLLRKDLKCTFCILLLL